MNKNKLNETQAVVRPFSTFRTLLLAVFCAALMVLCASPSAQAATVTKDAAGTDLTAGASWGGTAPTAADAATWGSTSLGAGLTLATSSSWGSISVLSPSTNITITGAGTLTLTSGIDMTASTVSISIGTPVALGASQTWNANSGNTLTASGIVSGTFDINKTGAGTLALSGANDYTGITTISAGTVVVGNATALGTTAGITTIVSGGTLDLNGQTIAEPFGAIIGTGATGVGALINNSGTAASITGDIAAANLFMVGGSGNMSLTRVTGGGSAITKVGAGTLTLGGTADNNSLALSVSANSGTVILNKASSTLIHAIGSNASVASGSTVQLSGSGNFQIYGANTFTVSNGGVLDLNGNSQDFNALNGILNLNGTGISSGGALINNTGTTSTISNMGTGTVALQSNSSIGGSGNITISSVVSGTGFALTKVGAGSLILTGANSYTGATTINAGTLQLGNGGASGTLATGSSITVATGGNLAFNNNAADFAFTQGTNFANQITGAGSVTMVAGNLTMVSATTNNYSGGFNLLGGRVFVGTNAAAIGTGTLTLAGGQLSSSQSGGAGQTLTTTNPNIWSGNFGLESRVTAGSMVWNNNGTVLLSGGSRTVTGATAPSLNLGGVVSDGGNGFGLTFTGMTSVSMSAVNTYTGGTTIGTAFPLTISGSGSLGSGNYAGAISNVGTFNYSSSADQIFSGAITGTAGILNKNTSATSTLTLSGSTANTYTGLTTVSAGTLVLSKLNGSNAVNAIAANGLTVGSAGVTAATVRYAASTTNPDMMGAGAVNLLGRGILDFNGASDTIGNVAITATGAGTSTTPIINTAGGGNLTIGTLGITPVAGFTSVVNAGTGTITLGGDVTFTAVTTGKAQISGTALALGAANRSFTVGQGFGASEDLLVDAQITGVRLLTKAGTGRLTLANTNAYTLGTTVSAGTLLLSGAFNMPSAGTLAVSTGGTFSLADGTARATTGATTGVGLTLAAGSYMSFDWNGGSLDNFTTAGTATSVAGNVVLDIRSVTPSGTGGTLITALTSAGSTLNNATYLLANNTNFTATITKTATTVSLGSPTFLAPLTDAYWRGGQVTGFLGTMTVSTGALSNWASDASATASGLTPGSTSNLIFGATGAAQQANVITGLSDMNVNSITFNDSTAVTIASSPNTITLNSTSGSAATTTAALATVTAGSAISVTSFANATNTISANLALGANQTWNVASGKTLAVSGVVLGSGSLTKADTGTVTLSGANTYNGGTTISAGTLRVGNATALGANSGAVSVVSGAVLDMNATAMTGTNALTLNGSGIGGTGALIGNGNSTYAGAIILGSASTIGNSSGTMNIGNVINLNGSSLTFDGAGSFSFDNNAAGISGAGGIIKNGTGQLIVNTTLTPTFTFTGDIVVNGGYVGFQTPATFFTGKNTKITGGYLGGRFGSGFTWTGGLGTGANQIQITGGTSGFSGEGGTGSTFLIGTAGSTLVWGASGQGIATGFFNPTVFLGNAPDRMNANGLGNLNNGIDLNGATRTFTSTQTNSNFAAGVGFTISGVISNSSATASGLTKTGAGQIVLASANTYNGLTTISAGVLQITNASGLQNSVLDTTNSITGSASAGLRISATTMTLGGLTGSKDLSTVFTSATGGYTLLTALTLNPGLGVSATYSGTTSGIANGAAGMTLTKTGAGTQTLTGTNTYTGATIINAGNLTLGFGGVASNILSTTSALTLGGGTLQLTGTGTQTLNGLTTTANTGSNILLAANETLTLGALTSAGAVSSLNFNTTAGGANASTPAVGTSIVVLTGQTAGNAINSGFTVSDAGGFGLATVDGSNQVIRQTTGTTLLPASGAVSTIDYRVDNNAGGAAAVGSSSLAVTSSESAKSITVDTTTSNGVLTLNTGVTLSNNTWNFGGTGTNTYNITGGTGVNTVATANTISINNVNTGTVTFTSPILAFGVNPVTVNGTGTTVLAGANTFTGATTISGGGTLRVTGNLVAAYNAAITIGAGSTFRYSNTSTSLTLGTVATISGAGGVTIDGGKDFTMQSGGDSYSGPTLISGNKTRLITGNVTGALSPNTAITVVGNGSGGGQLFPGIAGTYANNITISGIGFAEGDTQANFDGAIRLDGAINLSGTITLADNSRIGKFSGSTSTVSGQITGPFGIDFYGMLNTATQNSIFILSNPNNNYTGNTTIYNGIFNTTNVANLTTTLKLGASNVIPDGASAGNVVFAINGANNGATVILDLNGFSETINGLTVNSGTFATRITNSVAGASVLTIGNNNTSSTFGGTITNTTGTLAITKIGSGSLTLTGTNTYTGTTTVSAGTLAGTGSITSDMVVTGGTVAPGIPGGATGTFTAAGANFSGGGTLNIRAQSPSAIDKLVLTNAGSTANLNPAGGILNVDLTGFTGTGEFVIVQSNTWNTGAGFTVNILNKPVSVTNVKVSYLNVNVTSKQVLLSIDGSVTPVKVSDFAAQSEGAGINVSWTAVSEYQNAGFNLYRRAVESSEWVKVNPALIAGRITNPDEKKYAYLDWASAGMYEYQLE
ncbi:MAG: autotransporter-associated beta strand repeat-containing protein, partial [Planctomycetota bacterium]